MKKKAKEGEPEKEETEKRLEERRGRLNEV
jgi:hypothetical protein